MYVNTIRTTYVYAYTRAKKQLITFLSRKASSLFFPQGERGHSLQAYKSQVDLKTLVSPNVLLSNAYIHIYIYIYIYKCNVSVDLLVCLFTLWNIGISTAIRDADFL